MRTTGSRSFRDLFYMTMAIVVVSPVTAQTPQTPPPVQAAIAAGTIDVTATRIDGDPIPRQGYRFSQAHIALRRVDAANPKSAIALRVEVEITVDCEDGQGRPAQCPKTSVYGLPDEDFRIVRPEKVSRNNRGFVKYVGGGRDVRLGLITGLGNVEWVVLHRDHVIHADHQSVRLVVRDRQGVAAPPAAMPSPTVGADDLNRPGP